MYVLHYRNPVLVRAMEKVFWQFPALTDDDTKWNRLNERVQNQVKWMYNPVKFTTPRYEQLKNDLD